MKNNIEAIESLSDKLEKLINGEHWEELVDIINQQQQIITLASAKIDNNKEQRLLLSTSIKRALGLQKALIAKAHNDKEKVGKTVAELTNRKKMHTAYKKQ